ncbi:ABC transporter ATP-binding protein [Jeongeupia chitinilytica]|uniref:ABC transporter ATP-binding protein n=1 Tax=Jeongeupia chitinilytica TaxID=1041641 RepID=A0ABQ3GW15_9NEIS|nr:ABC transporter ATP-binding protein [Jeongeupia chitinilytica]
MADGPLDLLADISFSLPEGESLAIVGASGSGKSTLLALLAGLDLASSGSVALAGTDLASLDEDGRARLRGRLAGFVFQSFQLLPELTAIENVMLPLELASRKGARDIAAGWLERVGLGKRLEHTPRTLSGGEQQRVALARAFCTEPRILYADEPTGSLDTHTGEKIADLLFELNRETGATLVLVTHDEALAARCSTSLRIAAGRVIEQRGFAA